MRLEDSTDMAVVALLGFCIWETHKAYREAAPSLPDVRGCARGSDSYYSMRQSLIDADCTIGLVALGAGTTASYFTKSLFPIVAVMATLGAVAWYHHSVLNSDPV